MNKKRQHKDYKRFLLNRVTATPGIVEYIENCLTTDDEDAKHSFHKVMIHNWTDSSEQLFETISKYFSAALIPVNCTSGDITTFYTSNLNLINKILKLDFIFPYCRNMFNVDILFNDKCSTDCFGSCVTVEEVVTGVVSRRFSEKCELDLSNFCNDPEFIEKKICFYKLALLSNFKILMLRMGRDTKTLNLSNNNLSQAPLEVLNFFIRGALIAVNLSDNNIPTLQELQRVSSKIEKLWVEGNPLCEEMDLASYVKNITVKFPRLTELDGIKINQQGLIFPFFRNFLVNPDRRTKMIVEKFLTLYFSHYDSPNRRKTIMFYDLKCILTISTSFTEAEDQAMPHYASHSRNMKNPAKTAIKKTVHGVFEMKKYKSRDSAMGVLAQFPPSVHDPSTFCVDVLMHDRRGLFLIVDGIYKEIATMETPERFFQFRRTFIFNVCVLQGNSVYHISHEMFNISFATPEQIENSFKRPVRNMNALTLINPEPEESEAILKAFMNFTQLKRSEAESRLKIEDWDIRVALKKCHGDLRKDTISPSKFVEEDDFSDTSSLVDDDDMD